MVEPRRVELLSEDPSTRLSTSVADVLTFPPSGPQRQGQDFSSFIRSHLQQSLCRLVPHIDDARDPGRGQPGTDGHCLSSDGYEIRFVSCFFNFPLLTKRGASARLSGFSDPRRNHLRPHTGCRRTLRHPMAARLLRYAYIISQTTQNAQSTFFIRRSMSRLASRSARSWRLS